VERFNPVVAEIAKIIENPFFMETRRHTPPSSTVTDSSVVEDLMNHDIDILFNVLLDHRQYMVCSAANASMHKAALTFQGPIASLSANRSAFKKNPIDLRRG
jgi:hypothetical protein